MSDLSTTVPRSNKRANWVGLRTLRQVPKIVGRTTTGDPVFEVRSARLVLLADAAHFNRLLACSACGRDVPGPSVLNPAELDQGAYSVICSHCAKTAEGSALAPAERRTAAAERPALGDAAQNGAGNSHGPLGATDGDRLAALERRVADLTEAVGGFSSRSAAGLGDGFAGVLGPDEELQPPQVASDEDPPRAPINLVVPHQPHEVPTPVQMPPNGASESGRPALERRLHDAVYLLTEALNGQRGELQAALREGLDELRSMITSATAASAGRFQALEEQAQELQVEVSELRELQAVLDGGMGEVRSGIATIRVDNEQLADAQAHCERRLEALADVKRAAPLEPWGGRGLSERSAGASASVGVVSAAAGEPVLEQQRLKAQAALEEATNAVVGEAARASTGPVGLVPLRRHVTELQEQVLAHNEALEAVRRSVERLRRRLPTEPRPASGRVVRATKR